MIRQSTNGPLQAYSALMHGYLRFEEQKWQEALDQFVAARCVFF